MRNYGIIIENYSVDNLISIYGGAYVQKEQNNAKAASGNDLNTLLDVFDR